MGLVSADLVRELSEAGEVDLDGRDAETVAGEASDLVMERLLSDPLYDDLVRECIGEAVSVLDPVREMG